MFKRQKDWIMVYTSNIQRVRELMQQHGIESVFYPGNLKDTMLENLRRLNAHISALKVGQSHTLKSIVESAGVLPDVAGTKLTPSQSETDGEEREAGLRDTIDDVSPNMFKIALELTVDKLQKPYDVVIPTRLLLRYVMQQLRADEIIINRVNVTKGSFGRMSSWLEEYLDEDDRLSKHGAGVQLTTARTRITGYDPD